MKNLKYCPGCGKKLTRAKVTDIRCCIPCKTGYHRGTGKIAKGQIQIFDITKMDLVAVEFERVTGDLDY